MYAYTRFRRAESWPNAAGTCVNPVQQDAPDSIEDFNVFVGAET